MDMEHIRKAIESDLPGLKEKFSLRRLAVFGSVARGTASDGSDVDILVEFDRPAGFDEFMDLRFYLEDLLGARVDLVTSKAVRSRMRDAIDHEAVDVA
jgi:predicted nucleotidyltransferase